MAFLEDWLQEAAKQTAMEAAMDAQIFFAFLDAMIKRCLLGPFFFPIEQRNVTMRFVTNLSLSAFAKFFAPMIIPMKKALYRFCAETCAFYRLNFGFRKVWAEQASKG